MSAGSAERLFSISSLVLLKESAAGELGDSIETGRRITIVASIT
jgi:hypothetical protein